MGATLWTKGLIRAGERLPRHHPPQRGLPAGPAASLVWVTLDLDFRNSLPAGRGSLPSPSVMRPRDPRELTFTLACSPSAVPSRHCRSGGDSLEFNSLVLTAPAVPSSSTAMASNPQLLMLLRQQLLGDHPCGTLTALLPTLLLPPPCAHIGRAHMPGNCSLARACLTNETPESSGVVSVAGQFPRQNRGCVSGPWKEAPCPVDSEWWVGSHGVSRAAGDMVGKCRKRGRGAGSRACVMATCCLSVLTAHQLGPDSRGHEDAAFHTNTDEQ